MKQMTLSVLVLFTVVYVKIHAETSQDGGKSRFLALDHILRFLRRQDGQYNSGSPTEDLPVFCGHGNYCPAKHTCCRGHSGYWACCPLPKATCCPDGVHCCPFGYHCSMITRKCQKSDLDAVTMMKKVSALRIEAGNVVLSQAPITISKVARLDREVTSMEEKVVTDQAPMAIIKEAEKVQVYCDRTHVCPAGNTCCRQHSGGWGCCPHLKATCCRDNLHCCPYGYRCSVFKHVCLRGDNDVLPILKKTPAKKLMTVDNTKTKARDRPETILIDNPTFNEPQTELNTKYVEHFELSPTNLMPEILPKRTYCNGTHYCPDRYTCCQSHFGHWSCCPGLRATCCSDGIHCCPQYLRCDIIHNRCVKDDGLSTDWADIQPIDRN